MLLLCLHSTLKLEYITRDSKCFTSQVLKERIEAKSAHYEYLATSVTDTDLSSLKNDASLSAICEVSTLPSFFPLLLRKCLFYNKI